MSLCLKKVFQIFYILYHNCCGLWVDVSSFQNTLIQILDSRWEQKASFENEHFPSTQKMARLSTTWVKDESSHKHNQDGNARGKSEANDL